MEYEQQEGFGLIGWLFFLFVLFIIIVGVLFIELNLMDKKELDQRVEEAKIEISANPPIEISYPMQDVTEEEMQQFRDYNGLK